MARRARPVLGRRGVPLTAIAASALLLCACDAGSVDLILPSPTPTHEARPVAEAAPVGIAYAPLRGTPADGVIGPDLTHLASRRSLAAGLLPNTTEDFELWIARTEQLKPDAHMPAFGMLPTSEIAAIAAYLGSLK